MMTFYVYICTLEQKLACKEIITKDCDHQKEEMLVSKDEKIAEIFEKELVKHARLKEWVKKKLFDERWQAKHCVEQGDALRVVIKTNEHLPMNAY